MPLAVSGGLEKTDFHLTTKFNKMQKNNNLPRKTPLQQTAVMPRFFDLNIFKVFEDKTKIVFNVPISVMLIDTTTNRELMNTLFKCVTVEQKQSDFSMQIVTCHKK